MLLGDIRRLLRLRGDAVREKIVVQEWRVRPHGCLDVGNVGQHFVVDGDQ
jgi:hypothetical protein